MFCCFRLEAIIVDHEIGKGASGFFVERTLILGSATPQAHEQNDYEGTSR